MPQGCSFSPHLPHSFTPHGALCLLSAGPVSPFALLSSSCRTCQRVCCHALAVIPLGPSIFFPFMAQYLLPSCVETTSSVLPLQPHKAMPISPPLLQVITISTHLFLAGIGYSRTCDTLSGWSGKNKGKKQKNRKMAMKAKYPNKVIILLKEITQYR